MNYSSYVSTLSNLLVVPQDDANFIQILPSIIDYAEMRIYRDLDLLSTVVVDNSSTLTANTRNVTVPVPSAGPYGIVDQINLLESGSRTPLTPVSREVLDLMWPSSTAAETTTRPVMFCMTNQTTASFGPPAGDSVTLEFVGRVDPNPLSEGNPTTYLTEFLPDVFLVASMVFASGWQQNFGASTDNPQGPVTWENQYKQMIQAVDGNSVRTKFAGASWTSKRVEPFAQPQRG